MSLQDRDFMREPPPSAGTWFQGSPAYVHLIALNVAVWVLLLFLGADSAATRANFLVSPAGVFEGFRVWTLLTSAFAHFELMHIALNMILLYVMGRILARRGWTNGDLWALYLAAGIGGSLAFCGLGALRGTWYTPALGASGAVYGFLVAGARVAPQERLFLWGVLPLPLWGLAVGYTALDLAGATGSFGGDRIAHAAHLGGAVVGLAIAHFALRPSRLLRRRAGPQLRVLQGGAREASPARPAPPPPAPAPRIDASTAAQVDELLRKIKREGLASLSDEERKILDEASRRYR